MVGPDHRHQTEQPGSAWARSIRPGHDRDVPVLASWTRHVRCCMPPARPFRAQSLQVIQAGRLGRGLTDTVAAVEAELLEDTERRAVPGPHGGPKTLPPGCSHGVYNSFGGFRGAATPMGWPGQLERDLWFLEARSANDEAATADEISLFAPLDREQPAPGSAAMGFAVSRPPTVGQVPPAVQVATGSTGRAAVPFDAGRDGVPSGPSVLTGKDQPTTSAAPRVRGNPRSREWWDA
jgi:hypothetical protein